MFQSVANITTGVALLDKAKPGWAALINADTLDVADPDRCPLGQVFGSYTDGLQVVGLTFGSPGGFCSTGGLMTDGSLADLSARRDEYPTLNMMWQTIVRDRQSQSHQTGQ